MKKFSWIKALILPLITCGIYGIYWFVCLTNEMNKLSDTKDTSGGLCFLLNLITCNIYGIYWVPGIRLVPHVNLYNHLRKSVVFLICLFHL